jgi:Fe2+ or Zn2+ uptake regulation protein
MENLTSPGERRLRASRKRITPQRRLILDILSHADGHLDASAIYARARHRAARLSLATVYRTLNALKQAGVVRELHLDDERHYYELDRQDKHSHLVCLVCGRVVEVESAAFVEAARAAGQAHGFEVATAHVELTGYCESCRRPQSEAQGGSAPEQADAAL